MTETINQLAICAATNESQREKLIRDQEIMILRTASSACNAYVDKSDDAWSTALFAFSRAIDLYSIKKGDFLPFARMIIKRALIDAYRKRKRAACEVPVAPHVLAGQGEPEEDTAGVYPIVVKISKEANDNSLRDEILAANELLSAYGFQFFDLTNCSPQQEKTRRECAGAIRSILSDSSLLAALKKHHALPLKPLSEISGVKRKTLDRYRKYIIMGVLILDGDYPQIADYLKFVREV